MTDEIRAMCAEILTLLDLYEDDERVDWDAWRTRARALLAQPVAEGPTDEELEKLAEPFSFVAEGGWDRSVYDETGYARAVLARWGRPTPQPPADGEVAEVAAWLRLFCSEEYASRSHDPDVAWLTRAADLLEAHALPTPDATDD